MMTVAPKIQPPAGARPPRILLADDDGVSRRLLGDALTRLGFEILIAADGEEALQQIEKGAPDLLVLDFEMPGLNGAELCHHLRASEREDWRSLPVVMLTAHAGEAEEVVCLEAGANDFVTKPVSREVLAARINTQLRLQALADELREQNEELGRWRTAHEADLATAQATQRTLIPARPPALAGWSVQTIYQPVIQVGGDVFGWRPVGDGRWLFWLADATGHGASAALFTALAAQLFNHASERESEPEAILRLVDREFCEVFHGKSFMTACCAVVDPDGGLTFSGAGHPPLLIRRADGRIESLGPHGTMLGFSADHETGQTRTTLEPGDLALIYSDGLFALQKPDGERMMPDTLIEILPGLPPGPAFLGRLSAALQERSNGAPFSDDVAALVLFKE